MAEVKEDDVQLDPILKRLQEEVMHKAYMAINLSNIDNDPTLYPHWRLFNPISQLIQASITDEKTIPFFLSRVDERVREMRRQLDPSNLNDIIACNILQMFAGFFKYTNTSPSAAAKISDAHAEIERLKAALFNNSTELESKKAELAKLYNFKQMIAQAVQEMDAGPVLPFVPPPTVPLRAARGASKARSMPRDTPVTPAATKRQQKKATTLVRKIVETDAPAPSAPAVAAPRALLATIPPSTWDTVIGEGAMSPSSRIAQLPTDQFLKEVLGPDWNKPAEEAEPAAPRKKRRMRTIEEIMSEMAGEEIKLDDDIPEYIPPKKNRAGKAPPGDTGYNCPFDDCGRDFQKIPTMIDHTTSDHYWIGALQMLCSVCGEESDSERAFEIHQLNCIDAHIVFSVKKWDQQETQEEATTRPLREKRLLKCPFDGCDYSTKHKSRGIFKHISKRHKREGRASYRCDCGKMRRTISTMLFHHYQKCRSAEIEWFIERDGDKERERSNSRKKKAIEEIKVEEDDGSYEELMAMLNDAVNATNAAAATDAADAAGGWAVGTSTVENKAEEEEEEEEEEEKEEEEEFEDDD